MAKISFISAAKSAASSAHVNMPAAKLDKDKENNSPTPSPVQVYLVKT